MGDENEYVCFVTDYSPNEYAEKSIIMNATRSYILETYGDSDCNLFLHTPQIQFPITEEDSPISKYSSLLLKECVTGYTRPDWYLYLTDTYDNDTVFFYVKVYHTSNQEIPPLVFSISKEILFNGTISDLLKSFQESFTYDVKVNGLLIGGEAFPSDKLLKDVLQFDGVKTPDISINMDVSESSYKKLLHRSNLVHEIVTTEAQYIEDLKKLANYWSPQMKQRNLLTDSEQELIFKDLASILSCHSEFLNAISSVEKGYSSCVAPTFLDFSDYFRISFNFISSYPRILELLNMKMQVRAFSVAMAELTHALDGNDFLSYLITPVQRMPRYLLFLRELLKATPPTHPDFALIKVAYERIDETTQSAELQSERARQQTILFKIQAKIKKPSFTIVDPSRRIVFTRDVSIIKQRKESPATLYLCNDIIMVIKDRNKTARLTFSSQIINFHYSPIPGHFRSIRISLVTNPREVVDFQLVFAALEDKTTFFDSLKRLQNEDFSKNLHRFLVVWSLDAISDSVPAIYQQAAVGNTQSVIFSGGILSGKGQVSDFFTFDQQKVRQTALSQMTTCEMGTTGRRRHTLNYMNGSLYMIGGIIKDKEAGEVMKFDIYQKKWKQIIPRYSISRYGHSTVAHDGFLYVFGGKSKQTQITLFVKVNDSKSEEIHVGSTGPGHRFGHSAIIFDNKMFVFGGANQTGLLNELWSYDFASNSWKNHTVIGCQIKPRKHHLAFVMGDEMIIIGGVTDSFIASTISINLITLFAREATDGGNFPQSIRFASGGVIGHNSIVIYGGIEQKSKTPNNFVYFANFNNNFANKPSLVDNEEAVFDNSSWNKFLDVNPCQFVIAHRSTYLPTLKKSTSSSKLRKKSHSQKSLISEDSNPETMPLPSTYRINWQLFASTNELPTTLMAKPRVRVGKVQSNAMNLSQFGYQMPFKDDSDKTPSNPQARRDIPLPLHKNNRKTVNLFELSKSCQRGSFNLSNIYEYLSDSESTQVKDHQWANKFLDNDTESESAHSGIRPGKYAEQESSAETNSISLPKFSEQTDTGSDSFSFSQKINDTSTLQSNNDDYQNSPSDFNDMNNSNSSNNIKRIDKLDNNNKFNSTIPPIRTINMINEMFPRTSKEIYSGRNKNDLNIPLKLRDRTSSFNCIDDFKNNKYQPSNSFNQSPINPKEHQEQETKTKLSINPESTPNSRLLEETKCEKEIERDIPITQNDSNVKIYREIETSTDVEITGILPSNDSFNSGNIQESKTEINSSLDLQEMTLSPPNKQKADPQTESDSSLTKIIETSQKGKIRITSKSRRAAHSSITSDSEISNKLRLISEGKTENKLFNGSPINKSIPQNNNSIELNNTLPIESPQSNNTNKIYVNPIMPLNSQLVQTNNQLVPHKEIYIPQNAQYMIIPQTNSEIPQNYEIISQSLPPNIQDIPPIFNNMQTNTTNDISYPQIAPINNLYRNSLISQRIASISPRIPTIMNNQSNIEDIRLNQSQNKYNTTNKNDQTQQNNQNSQTHQNKQTQKINQTQQNNQTKKTQQNNQIQKINQTQQNNQTKKAQQNNQTKKTQQNNQIQKINQTQQNNQTKKTQQNNQTKKTQQNDQTKKTQQNNQTKKAQQNNQTHQNDQTKKTQQNNQTKKAQQNNQTHQNNQTKKTHQNDQTKKTQQNNLTKKAQQNNQTRQNNQTQQINQTQQNNITHQSNHTKNIQQNANKPQSKNKKCLKNRKSLTSNNEASPKSNKAPNLSVPPQSRIVKTPSKPELSSDDSGYDSYTYQRYSDLIERELEYDFSYSYYESDDDNNEIYNECKNSRRTNQNYSRVKYKNNHISESRNTSKFDSKNSYKNDIHNESSKIRSNKGYGREMSDDQDDEDYSSNEGNRYDSAPWRRRTSLMEKSRDEYYSTISHSGKMFETEAELKKRLREAHKIAFLPSPFYKRAKKQQLIEKKYQTNSDYENMNIFKRKHRRSRKDDYFLELEETETKPYSIRKNQFTTSRRSELK